MTKIDKPANEPEVAMARWDESHVSSKWPLDIDNDTFVGRGGHRHCVVGAANAAFDVCETLALLRHMGLVCGVSGCSHEAANAPGFPPRCNHHYATPEEIAAMRDRIAELEQVAIDQAEKIASIWGSE